MIAPKHDTLVRRLALILIKLNQGERLDPVALAEEFSVTLRTIQRDLNVRFSYLPLERVDARYQLDPAFLGKLGRHDVEQFAKLAGVRGLFPSISDDFLRDLFDTRIDSTLLVKGHHYEDLQGKELHFEQLQSAIVTHQRISFDFRKDDARKGFADVEPHKLVNHKGIWYLAAKDEGKLKTFSFSRIEQLIVTDQTFVPDLTVEKMLLDDDGIWLGEQRQKVVMTIAKEAAGYFRRRKLIANQVIEKELEDGGLVLSTNVAHINQILPSVRYWIPHIRIISPAALQADMERELVGYLQCISPVARCAE